MPGENIVLALIGAVPATIASLAALTAARRTGKHGDLSKQFRRLKNAVNAHHADLELHYHSEKHGER
jgi:hypothetical protein